MGQIPVAGSVLKLTKNVNNVFRSKCNVFLQKTWDFFTAVRYWTVCQIKQS